MPRLTLDIGVEFQRRMYLFPKAYGKLYLCDPLVATLRQELATGGIFLDVGSNVGVYSLLAAELVGPQGAVVAFEPDPVAFEALRRSALLSPYHNIRPVNLAVSDVNTEGILFRDSPGSTANSLVGYKSETKQADRDVIRVAVTTIDDYITSSRIDPRRIRLVKIDVEGAEAMAVAGMLATLKQASYPPIWCEVRGSQGSIRSPDTFSTVTSLLSPLGYRSFLVSDASEIPIAEVSGRENVLFRYEKGYVRG